MAYVALEDFNSGVMDRDKYTVTGSFANHSNSVQHKTEGACGLYYDTPPGSWLGEFYLGAFKTTQYIQRKEGMKFKISLKGDTKSASGTSYRAYSSGLFNLGVFNTSLVGADGAEEIFGYFVRVNFHTLKLELAVSADDGTGTAEIIAIATTSFVSYTGWKDLIVEIGSNGIITVKLGTSSMSAIDTTHSVGGYMIAFAPNIDYKNEANMVGQIAVDNLMYDSGITEPPPLPSDTPPSPTIKSVSNLRISDEANKNNAIVVFCFDQDVVQWSVNVLGVSYDTGIIADSGLNATKDQDLTAVISFSELYREGSNRVNIYGKNVSGIWTPFVSDGNDSDDII